MTARPTPRPRAPRARRAGFVIGLVVFGGLVFLALAIYPTLFFSGSQTRSEALSANRWRGRVLARGGLKLGASLLRKQRWWNTPEGDPSPSIGTKTSAELGVPATAGAFTLVAESIIGMDLGAAGVPPEQIPPHLQTPPGGSPINPLERVDLFVRAQIDDDVVVAYGAFVMSPRPAYHGQDSIMPGGSSRLVRVQFFTGSEFHAIEDIGVRDGIRSEIESQAALFLKNYATVNFRATPSSQATGALGDGQATAFMEQWLRTPPPDEGAAFLRDRIFDVLFEGTPVGQRDEARQERDLVADLEACSGEALQVIAEAEWFCANDMEGDCTWADPACLTPREWDYDSGDASGDDTVLHLREADLADASVDGGYIGRMASTEPILRTYEYSCDIVEFLDRPPRPPDADGDGVYEDSSGINDPGISWPPAPAPSGAGANLPASFWPDFCPAGDPNDQCFCVNVQASVSEPNGTVAYILTDEVTGYEQNLAEVASYFQRQLLRQGDAVGSAQVRFNRYRTGETNSIVDDDGIIDDDGDVDDDGIPNGSDPDFDPPPPPEDDDDDPPSPPSTGGSGSFGGGGSF